MINGGRFQIVESKGENSRIRFKGQGNLIAYFVRLQASVEWKTASVRFAAMFSIIISSDAKEGRISG